MKTQDPSSITVVTQLNSGLDNICNEFNKMAETTVIGDWKGFEFKMIQPQDHPRVIKHLRDCFHYPALYRLGYTKEMDDDMDFMFQSCLDEGHNLSFFVEEKATGKIAGCRVITLEKRGVVPSPPLKYQRVKDIFKLYYSLVEDCNVFNRYNIDVIPHMFGVSVDPEFTQQGLATEIYKRAIALLKAKNYSVALVAFISPYSRAAANHYGFVQLAKKNLIEAIDEDGNAMNPDANPEEFFDTGVFEF